MLNLCNCSPLEFQKRIKNKKLYLFGAGRVLQYLVQMYCGNKEIEKIIDNNPAVLGKKIFAWNQQIEVINIEMFKKEIGSCSKNDLILWITPSFQGFDILEQLDQISAFDGIECYLTHLLRYYPVNHEKLEFTQGIQNQIPKKIHYCWLGGKTIPAHLQCYIDGWKALCPDYEIILWNESNYDFTKNLYMKQALEKKAWGFVTDCARLDLLYENGGIYLDVDVELVQKPDKLMNDGAFFGFGCTGINLGAGFGCCKGHTFVKQLRDYYEGIKFINDDGSLNTLPCVAHQHPVFSSYGFDITDKYQKINDVVLYPSSVMADSGIDEIEGLITENTFGIHHSQLSWIKESEREKFMRMKKEIKRRLEYSNNQNLRGGVTYNSNFVNCSAPYLEVAA